MGQPYSSTSGDLKRDGKLEDILTNQLCLLPDRLRGDVEPVNKVVMCCSEVLGSYLKWSEYGSFYQKLREAYCKDRESYLKKGGHGNACAIREVVKQFSQEERYKAGFHHVLTEMAFLQIRAEHLKNSHGIIPVPLTRNSYDDCLARFISATTVRMEDIPRFEEQAQAGREVYPNQNRHLVLFKLIERILVGSDEAQTILNKFWNGYNDCIFRLENEPTFGESEFRKLMDSIFGEIERALHKQLAANVKQFYPAWKQMDIRLLDQSRNLTQIQTGVDLLVEKLLGNLQENIQKLRANYLEGLEQDREIKDALANYVSLEGMPLHDSTRFDLESKIQEFLKSNKKVLLLLGDAGSGKSTFNRHLAVGLWEAYMQANAAKDRLIPIFIQLSSLPESNRNLVEAFFETQGVSKEQIKALQSEHRFVLILDGFDEIRDRQRLFYKDNQLDNWKETKIIISSRPEYLGQNYQYKFHASGKPRALQEYRLAPFSEKTIERYVDQYKKAHPEGPWSVEQYNEALKRRDLKELVGNPFLLKITLSVLPELSKALKEKDQRFTRLALYDQFVKSWFDRSQQRLAQIQLDPGEAKEFRQLEQRGFAERGVSFSKRLAAEMYRAGEVVTTYSAEADDPWEERSAESNDTWRKRLLGDENAMTVLMRLNAPLIRQGEQYRFIHKSLLDYFVAQELGEQVKQKIEKTLLFNRLNLVEDHAVLGFLAERVKQERILRVRLLECVEHSKTDANFQMASANALTVLVRAGVQFNNMDFNGIQVAGADLSYGVFDSTQFEGASLSRVKLRGAWLREANMHKAKLDDVVFGEKPALDLWGAVWTCCYSPDGYWLAVGTKVGSIQLYQAETLELKQTFEGYLGFEDHGVRSVAFSPDSKWLASGDDDNRVRLWSIKTGKLWRVFIGHSYEVESVAFSPDGQWLASGSHDKCVKLWSVNTGELKQTFEGHSDGVVCIAFSLDGQYLASGGCDNLVKLWTVKTGKLQCSLEGHTDQVNSISFSSDGKWLASGSADKTVKLWELESTGALLHETLEGHASDVASISFSSDGRWLASGSWDNTIRLWELKNTGALLRGTLEGHGDHVTSVSFSPDVKWLASGSWDDTVRLWELESAGLHERLEGHSRGAHSVSFSPDGKWLASGRSDSSVELWEIRSTDALLRGTLKGHSHSVRSVSFSSDGKWLASGSQDSTVKLWKLERTGALLHETLEGHNEGVTSVSFSPDGKWLASGSFDKTANLWELKSDGAFLCETLGGYDWSVKKVSFSSDGKWLASGSTDGEIDLWDLESLESTDALLCKTLEGRRGMVWDTSFSPDWRWLASAGHDYRVSIWSVDSGECKATIGGFGQIHSVVWQKSSDSAAKVATIGSDGATRIWRVESKENELQVSLWWTSYNNKLTAVGTSIQGAQGLSIMNERLLKQRGASGEPSLI